MADRRVNRTSNRYWTEAQDALLREFFPHWPTAWLAEHFDMSASRINHRAGRLGIHKSPDYLATPLSGRTRPGSKIGGATRFKKGLTPWNKGKHYTAGGRSAETRFKKGHLSGRARELKQPIGAERVSKDGYLERKINNDLPFQRRWRAVHLIEWEKVNGPLPKGHCLAFKDGNKTHIALDNLELITRRENMRRNTIHHLPGPLVEVIRLKGALKRQINKRTQK